jgi:hypothetical protein
MQAHAATTRFVLAKIGTIACASENLPIRPAGNQAAHASGASGFEFSLQDRPPRRFASTRQSRHYRPLLHDLNANHTAAIASDDAFRSYKNSK